MIQHGAARHPDVDAVVVGSGPNGLVGAVTLAEAGMRVLVVEAADTPGGGLRTEELTLPGFRHDVCATVLPLALASPALRDTVSPQLQWAHPTVAVAHPLDDGEPAALLRRDLAATAAGLNVFGDSGRQSNRADSSGWQRLLGPLVRDARRLTDSVLSPLDLPPTAAVPLARFGARGLWPATTTGRVALRGDRARALLAGLSAHSMLDLHRPVTAGYGLLLGALAHHVGWPVAVGGSASLVTALVHRLHELGGELVTGTRVRRLSELPAARIVLLDLTPRQVLAVAGEELPVPYRIALARYRYGPAAFKVDWALDAPVPWRDAAVADAGTVHLGGTLDEVAAAERTVARGGHPSRPFVLFVQATVADPSRAPAGKHTAWAYCHVPLGSTVDMTAAVEAQVERFAPGFAERVLARHVMPPKALEAHNANEIGGDIAGGTTDLRQLFTRPVRSWNPWRTPLPGVYLCSSSTPPGAGAHGMGGWNAARRALAELRG